MNLKTVSGGTLLWVAVKSLDLVTFYQPFNAHKCFLQRKSNHILFCQLRPSCNTGHNILLYFADGCIIIYYNYLQSV